MSSRTFPTDLLRHLDIPYNAVSTEHIDSGRWVEYRVAVFEHEGKHWLVHYQRGLTEMQDVDPWGYATEVEAWEVERGTRTITIDTWLPVEG